MNLFPVANQEAVEAAISKAQITSGMIKMGERISWGSNSAAIDTLSELCAALTAERDALAARCKRKEALCDQWAKDAEKAEAERDALREFVERVADGHPKDYTGNFAAAQALLDKFPTHQKTAV